MFTIEVMEKIYASLKKYFGKTQEVLLLFSLSRIGVAKYTTLELELSADMEDTLKSYDASLLLLSSTTSLRKIYYFWLITSTI